MKLPQTMHAMVLYSSKSKLKYTEVPLPEIKEGQVLIKVIACGMCRTDLHIIDGELDKAKFPLILGHEIIGQVVKLGSSTSILKVGDHVGLAWLAYTCGTCKFCKQEKENLCEHPEFTGYTVDGGYATYTAAWEQFCYPLPPIFATPAAAPLMCAGLIGYRSYRMIEETAMHIGIYGFGAAGHIVSQLASYQGKNVYAFTREGDEKTQSFALEMGAVWAGDSLQSPPEKLDGAIIFAPTGSLVPKALIDVDKGRKVICGGIHMTDIPSFPYEILWEERSIHSVANLTRADGRGMLKLAAEIPIIPSVQLFDLKDANKAVDGLRNGRVKGAAVLVMATT